MMGSRPILFGNSYRYAGLLSMSMCVWESSKMRKNIVSSNTFSQELMDWKDNLNLTERKPGRWGTPSHSPVSFPKGSESI